MERRGYLRLVGVTGAGALAGCGVLQSESGGTADGFTPEAADHLAVAVGKLNTVALAVDTFQGDDPRESTFDEPKPRERLETAREALDEAQTLADESQQPDVDAVRDYLATVESTVDAVVGLLSASEGLEQAEERMDGTEVEVGDVQEPITQAREASTGAVDARDRALSASSEADGDRLATLDAEFEALRDGLETLSRYVTGVDGLAGGYDTYLGGVETLQDADDAVSDDAFETAREVFSQAVDEFDAASERFGDALADAPETLISDLERGTHRSDALGHFAVGHVTLLDGRLELDTATTALENEEFEAARDSLNIGNDAALTASEQFADGVDVPIDEFDDQFETADLRAAAMEALTDGYITLLNARESIDEAETALFDDDYDVAREGFQQGAQQSRDAVATFQSVDGDDLFAESFDRAIQRARAIESLADGYANVTDGLAAIDDGRDSFDSRDFDTAADHFDAAGDSFAAAGEVFETGRDDAGEMFDANFERALCQVEHLEAGADLYQTAAEAAADRNRSEAESAQDDAEDELEQAEDC